jgi:hypothetical protein
MLQDIFVLGLFKLHVTVRIYSIKDSKTDAQNVSSFSESQLA